MKKSRIQLISIIVLAALALSLLLSTKATPDMIPFFALKRAQEQVFLKFKPGLSDRLDYMRGMLNSRLEELQSVVRRKNYDYVLKASLRYSTLAGQITELAKGSGKVEEVKKQFLEHQKILDELYVAYPKNTDNLEYKYIQDDYNYLKIYLDKLAELK